MTNLQNAYRRAAKVFVETVMEGEPERIMHKIEECPIIRDCGLENGGTGVVYKSSGHSFSEMSARSSATSRSSSRSIRNISF